MKKRKNNLVKYSSYLPFEFEYLCEYYLTIKTEPNGRNGARARLHNSRSIISSDIHST